jgi:hypothetical protein
VVGLSLEDLGRLDAESWRYRLYHYADYFMNVGETGLPESPGAAEWRAAITAKVVELARRQEDAECALGWGSTPRLGAMPAELTERRIAVLAAGQTDDGGWGDAHGLPQWRALTPIWALKALQEQADLEQRLHGRDGTRDGR